MTVDLEKTYLWTNEFDKQEKIAFSFIISFNFPPSYCQLETLSSQPPGFRSNRLHVPFR
jgi:hypothetical protein